MWEGNGEQDLQKQPKAAIRMAGVTKEDGEKGAFAQKAARTELL